MRKRNNNFRIGTVNLEGHHVNMIFTRVRKFSQRHTFFFFFSCYTVGRRNRHTCKKWPGKEAYQIELWVLGEI